MKELNEIKTEKEIGKGVYGTIYLVKNKGKKYALKIEKILEKNSKIKTSISPYWREIKFVEKMSKKYTDHFLQIKKHKLVKNCKHSQYSKNTQLKNIHKKYHKLVKSSYCVYKLYSYCDTTLANLIFYKEIYKEQNKYYSLILQVFYILYLLNKHGYQHNDLHLWNIGVKYTNKKEIKIFGKKIPTYGYLVQLIDYGKIMHKNDKKNKKDTKLWKTTNDLLSFISYLKIFSYGEFYNYMDTLLDSKKKNYSIPKPKIYKIYRDYKKEFDKQTETKVIYDILEKVNKETKKYNYEFFYDLYNIIFYRKEQDKFYDLRRISKKYRKYFEPKLYIDFPLYLIIIYNFDKIENIINYLLNNYF